jgi:hypothetical protein
MVKPLVRNAGDPEQVKSAGDVIEKRRFRELSDIAVMMAMPEGRRFAWRVLNQCGLLKSVWHPSAEIHYKAGQQDIGHWYLAEILEAQPTAFIQMLQEALKVESENG